MCPPLQTTIPGFRKGKAPAAIVLNHFGKQSVTAEACEEIIGAAVPVALQMKDIRVRFTEAVSTGCPILYDAAMLTPFPPGQAIGQAKMADENAIANMLKDFAPGQVSHTIPYALPQKSGTSLQRI